MGALWAWNRCQWRRRRGGPLAATLLFARAVAIVLTAAAGARRTQTAYPRMVEATAASLQAVAFWILAAVLALTSLTLVAHLEARATHAEDDEFPVLGSLGMSRWDRAAVAVRGRLMVGTVAAATAVVLAFVSSPLTPIGLARIAEPDPGLRFDAPELLRAG